jgi:hypothetical protein
LDALLDNQIVLVNDDGTVQKRGDFLATVKVDNSQEQQVAPESMIRVFGCTAIASGVFRATGVEGGKSGPRSRQILAGLGCAMRWASGSIAGSLYVDID